MRFRFRSIRARTFFLVLTPLLSLVGLSIFATAVAANNAIALERATTVRDSLADPIGLFTVEMQQERLAAALFLARPSRQAAAAMQAQEPGTNAALSAFQKVVGQVAADGDPDVRSAISVLLRDAAGLPGLRAQALSKSISKAAAEQAYTAIIAAGYQAIAASFLQMPNVHLVNQSSAVLRVAEAEDELLQAQALLAADTAARSFPPADRVKFAMLTGGSQGLLSEALPDLDPVYRASFTSVIRSQPATKLNALNAQVINGPPGKTGVSATAYGQVAQTVALGLGLAAQSVGNRLAGALRAAAGPINTQLAVTGGVGLAAIITSIALSVWIGRGIVRELAGLRGEALELARRRLPQVMARLSSGEDVDVEAEAPLLPASADEIGQVRQAFNTVRRAAIEAAAGQAKLRSGVATVFRNLALRSESLLHQQLSLLDILEQRADGPEELERLFQIDHLATRMRRNAEGLLVLAGDQPGRTWTDPVPMVDVLRGSVAEVVGYARIRVACFGRAALHGHAVADVIHLIAELAENATAYSPPQSSVRVSGSTTANGFAVEVEDRGLGIPADMTARLNASLADPPPFNLAESAQLGLVIAARLAQRHGISITLRDSAYGGTTAIVFIPRTLMIFDEPDPSGQVPAAAPQVPAATGHARRDVGRATALSGRHRSRDIPHGAGVHPADPAASVHARVPDNFGRQASPTASPPGVPDQLAGDEFQLPRRTRMANLPPHLLKPPPAPPVAGRVVGREPGDDLSAEALRAAFADLQSGMERGNREDLVASGREEYRGGLTHPRSAGPATWPTPASERSTGDNDRRR
jgi:signal transduction histidine kinase